MSSTGIGRVTSGDGTSIAYERVGAGPAVILVDAAGNFRGFSPMPQLAGSTSCRRPSRPCMTRLTARRRPTGRRSSPCTGSWSASAAATRW